jgi:signal transduction histidine kinase
VSITVQKIDNDEVIVNIKDNGIGIDLRILPKLFTKFATKSQTGTGLGMFISKSIIEVVRYGQRIILTLTELHSHLPYQSPNNISNWTFATNFLLFGYPLIKDSEYH